jgi:hypothetical protein
VRESPQLAQQAYAPPNSAADHRHTGVPGKVQERMKRLRSAVFFDVGKFINRAMTDFYPEYATV